MECYDNMGAWIRIEEGMFHHPKIRRMGFPANALFIALLCEVKLHGVRGELSNNHWDAENFADILKCQDLDLIRHAMERLSSSGLVKLLPDGGLVVPNWQKYQMDRTAADRMQRWRDKQKQENSDVTQRNVTQRNGCYGNTDRQTYRQREDRSTSNIDVQVQDQDGQVSSIYMNMVAGPNIVDHMIARFPTWSQDQAESSYMKLRGFYPQVTAKQWIEIIDEAYASSDNLPTNRIHNWIYRQAGFYLKSKSAKNGTVNDRVGKRQYASPAHKTNAKVFEETSDPVSIGDVLDRSGLNFDPDEEEEE